MRFLSHIAVLLLLLLCTGCQSPTEGTDITATPDRPQSGSPSPSLDMPPPSPDETSTPAEEALRLHKTTIKARQGQKWELEAVEVDWSSSRSKADAKDVNWWLLDESDKRWVKIVSPEAEIDMDHEIVTFKGKTVATRLNTPESLVVQKLIYNGKDRLFYGSGGVVWKKAGMELTGETLTATPELDKVQLKGRVQGRSKGESLFGED